MRAEFESQDAVTAVETIVVAAVGVLLAEAIKAGFQCLEARRKAAAAKAADAQAL